MHSRNQMTESQGDDIGINVFLNKRRGEFFPVNTDSYFWLFRDFCGLGGGFYTSRKQKLDLEDMVGSSPNLVPDSLCGS